MKQSQRERRRKRRRRRKRVSCIDILMSCSPQNYVLYYYSSASIDWNNWKETDWAGCSAIAFPLHAYLVLQRPETIRRMHVLIIIVFFFYFTEDDSKGVPEFWLTVFKNVDLLSDMIQEHDEPILQHLTDLKVKFNEADPMVSNPQKSFQWLDFYSKHPPWQTSQGQKSLNRVY